MLNVPSYSRYPVSSYLSHQLNIRNYPGVQAAGIQAEGLRLVYLVYLVDLIHLVSFVQPDRQDRPNRPNEQGQLAGLHSIQLTAFSLCS
jgi:hypothetical protein